MTCLPVRTAPAKPGTGRAFPDTAHTPLEIGHESTVHRHDCRVSLFTITPLKSAPLSAIIIYQNMFTFMKNLQKRT